MLVATVQTGTILRDENRIPLELAARLREEQRLLTRELLALHVPACEARRQGGSHTLDRIRGIRRRLRLVAQLIAELPLAVPESLAPDRAGFGTAVYVKDLDSGRERGHRLVCGEPDALDASQVSLASPLGRALASSRPGDVVTHNSPGGTRRLRILTLTTLPRALGMAGM